MDGRQTVDRTDGCTDGRLDVRTDRQTNGQTDVRTDEWTDRRTNGQSDLRMDGQTNGQTDGRTDPTHGQMVGRTTYGHNFDLRISTIWEYQKTST